MPNPSSSLENSLISLLFPSHPDTDRSGCSQSLCQFDGLKMLGGYSKFGENLIYQNPPVGLQTAVTRGPFAIKCASLSVLTEPFSPASDTS